MCGCFPMHSICLIHISTPQGNFLKVNFTPVDPKNSAFYKHWVINCYSYLPVTSVNGKCYYAHFTDEETKGFYDYMSHLKPNCAGKAIKDFQ